MMKFTLVAFFICCIFAATTASLTLDDLDRDFITEKVQNLDQLESEYVNDWSIIGWIKHLFSKTYKALKVVVRTAQGVLCAYDGAKEIHQSALAFPLQISTCGGEVPKSVKNVITDVNNVASQSKKLLNYNETICTGVSSKVPKACQAKLLSGVYNLYENVKKTITDAKKVKSAPGVAGQCMQTAVNTLIAQFQVFPSNVITCSKNY